MFFQEPTPDTSGYMIAGYVIAFIVMALYVASIYLRHRNLRQDMSILEEIEKPASPVQMAPKAERKKGPRRSASNKPVTKRSRKK